MPAQRLNRRTHPAVRQAASKPPDLRIARPVTEAVTREDEPVRP